MSGDNPRRTEEEWERIFRMKREIERMTEQHTLADVMAREMMDARTPKDQTNEPG